MGDGIIELHSTKGVNPYLTYCPRCGGESPVLVLIGRRTTVLTCIHCGTANIGSRRHEECGKCGERLDGAKARELEEHEKLPGALCEKCQKEIKEFEVIVKAGGVYFKCSDCGAQGIINGDTEFAKAVREHAKVSAPEPIGAAFTKDNCPQCGPDAVKKKEP